MIDTVVVKDRKIRVTIHACNGYMIKHVADSCSWVVLHPITDEVYYIAHSLYDARRWAEHSKPLY